ncbi:MAG TPA: hypothetical protein VHQ90_03375 [Thermoanaerobaculia bacterium]|nr:hypothetical protein [Thermoanaerobaculia bacterium]
MKDLELDQIEDGLCYLCGKPGSDSMDHVPPKNLFAPEDRKGLITVPTHGTCNRSFSKDDEYFRLCMTAAAYEDRQAHKVWIGPVLRGIHRPESARFKADILEHLKTAELRVGDDFVGHAPVMLQDPARLHGIANRIVRGLYRHLSGSVLALEWPVSSALMPPSSLQAFHELTSPLASIGNGTFLFRRVLLSKDEREGVYTLVFYRTVVFFGFTGSVIRSKLFPHEGKVLAGAGSGPTK